MGKLNRTPTLPSIILAKIKSEAVGNHWCKTFGPLGYREIKVYSFCHRCCAASFCGTQCSWSFLAQAARHFTSNPLLSWPVKPFFAAHYNFGPQPTWFYHLKIIYLSFPKACTICLHRSSQSVSEG